MDINIQLMQKDDRDYVTYVGPIDAEAEVHLTQLLPKLGDKVTFNFQQVETVNSCGVRSWINFMRELQQAGRDIIFEECTSEIIMQINMIPSSKEKRLLPPCTRVYDECGHEDNILFVNGKNLPDDPDAELDAVMCSECGAEMELEEMAEEFFCLPSRLSLSKNNRIGCWSQVKLS